MSGGWLCELTSEPDEGEIGCLLGSYVVCVPEVPRSLRLQTKYSSPVALFTRTVRWTTPLFTLRAQERQFWVVVDTK